MSPLICGDVGGLERDRPFGGLHLDRLSPSCSAFIGQLVQDELVDVAGVEGDEVLVDRRLEAVDLGQRVGQVHHVAHRETTGRPSSAAARTSAGRSSASSGCSARG